MRTEQALVAVGGRASRLRENAEQQPFAKSFMTADLYPLLHWCLRSLQLAGVKRVVLAGDKREHLLAAEAVVGELLTEFDAVQFFQDEGAGMHGLPYQTRHLLDETFFFECGHATNMPSHYLAMDTAKTPDNVVFSAYIAHSSNPRQPVRLEGPRVTPTGDEQTGIALAHPLLLDQAYANRLPDLGFNINRIIGHYATISQLSYVWNNMAPEFDTIEEVDHSLLVRRELRQQSIIAATMEVQPELAAEIRSRSH